MTRRTFTTHVVYPDGNPIEVAVSTSAIAALGVEDHWRERHQGGRFVMVSYDDDDGETGALFEGHPAVEREYDEQEAEDAARDGRCLA